MMRSTVLTAMVWVLGLTTLDAQAICRQPSAFCTDGRQLTADRRYTTENARASFQRTVVHNGKWVVAASVAAFTVVAASEHRLSKRDWDRLLTICRSDNSACVVGPDGRYGRADAEALYQRSRAYDRRANRWLVGAQVGLIATTALFIIDLHPGEGPENIPFPSQIRVGAAGGGLEMGIGYRLPAIR